MEREMAMYHTRLVQDSPWTARCATVFGNRQWLPPNVGSCSACEIQPMNFSDEQATTSITLWPVQVEIP